MKMCSGLMPSINAFFAGGFQLLALTKVRGEGNHLAAVGFLQPLEDNRGVEPARIREDNLVDIFLCGSACCRCHYPAPMIPKYLFERRTIGPADAASRGATGPRPCA